MFVRTALLSFTFVAVMAIIGVEASASPELQRTWEKAEIWVKPAGGGLINSHMDDQRLHQRLIKAGRKLPTVIFFHDCGKNRKLAGWHYARFMARAGFAVILPDSFARSNRIETCSHWQFRPLAGAPFDKVHALRKSEIAHALTMVGKLGWADTKNLFVMGQGEGADALAAYDGTGYGARVVSAALCRWGINGPTDVPTLVIASQDDRLFNGADAASCATMAGERSVEINLLPGYQHDTSSLPEARDAVIAFLRRQINR